MPSPARRPFALHLLALPVWGALALSGCILNAEACGEGFELQAGRCRPRPEYDAGDVPAFPDVPQDTFSWDAKPHDWGMPEPDASADPYTGTVAILVVDRTPDEALNGTPATPGFDLDGIEVLGEGVDVTGERLLESLIFDPFAQSIAQDDAASLGRAESSSDPHTFVSLGGGGAYQLLGISPPRPVRSGDRLQIYEFQERRGDFDQASVFACFTTVVDLSLCRYMGDVGPGRSVLRLE